MSYFERPRPIALIFGSFFAIFLPLVALQLLFGGAPWLQYLTAAQAVGLGTTHFFITLAVYLQSANLDYFNSSARNRVVYFAVPAAIFLLFALSEATQFRTVYPQAAAARIRGAALPRFLPRRPAERGHAAAVEAAGRRRCRAGPGPRRTPSLSAWR